MCKEENKENEDRISLLPDCLVHHILSFLNTKQVVQTCVLSERWKTVWTNIPTLNFDFNSYPFEITGSPSGNTSSGSKESSFKQFILSFISQRCGGHIQKLSYTSSNNCEEGDLAESLIGYARCQMVQELCIDTFDILYTYWRVELSNFQSLIVLKISCACVGDWGGLKLPSLRTLEITCYFEHPYEKKSKKGKMFPGCPNLESLVLVNYHLKTSSICAPKLEYLELCASAAWLLTSQEVQLITPNIRCIKFKNCLPTVKTDSDLSCLEIVNIEVMDYYLGFTDLPEFLRVFHNARSLTLPLKAIEFLLSAPALLDGSFLFHNLTHLKLKTKETDKMIDLLINLLADLQKRLTPKNWLLILIGTNVQNAISGLVWLLMLPNGGKSRTLFNCFFVIFYLLGFA